jgi:hypothetical protein
VRVFGVVSDDPVGEDDLGLGQGVEELDVEDLVAGAAVEGLDEGVLPGRARLDVGGGGLAQAAPVAQGVGDQLGAVVAADVLGSGAAGGDEAFEQGNGCPRR